MRLLLFNPENDLALADGGAHYTPPASACQMAGDLRDLPGLWAAKGDWVVPSPSVGAEWTAPPGEVTSVLPWGWSPLLVRQLHEAGLPGALLPTPEQMEAYRAASSRENCVRLLQQLREEWPEPFRAGALVGESVWAENEAEVLCALADYGGRAMLKAPWSGSGRGVHPVQGPPLTEKSRAWIHRTLQRQGGVEVEPLYERVQDLALEFWAEDGRVRYEGLSLFHTTAGGVYGGNLVATEEEKRHRLSQQIPLTLLDEVRQRLTALLDQAGLPAWYTGPLGIDMMIVKSFSFQLHPLLEMNLRMTMGWVALQLLRRLPERSSGSYAISGQSGHYQALFVQNEGPELKK